MTNALTTIETKILDSIMPDVAKMVLSGVDPVEAVKICLINQMDFAGEMAMNQTRKAQYVNNTALEIYQERKGLN